MGADLLVANLWSTPEATFDWEAGLAVAMTLTQEEAELLANQCALDAEDDNVLREAARERAHTHVEVLREHFEGQHSRVLTWFDSPDGRWRAYLTGGMSWGDSPSDLFDAVNDLWAVPRVLAATGFHVRLEEAPVRRHAVYGVSAGVAICVCGESMAEAVIDAHVTAGNPPVVPTSEED